MDLHLTNLPDHLEADRVHPNEYDWAKSPTPVSGSGRSQAADGSGLVFTIHRTAGNGGLTSATER